MKVKEGGEDAAENRIESAMNAVDVPRIYFNGFSCSLTAGDVTVALEFNKRPVCVTNMSYTMAKTLSQKLAGIVATLENVTGNTIMTTEDIALKMNAQQQEAE